MIWPGQLVINLYSEESFWGCPLYDVVAKVKSLVGPVNVDLHCMIIALHFSGCGTIEFLSHHSWSSARTLFSEFVSKSIVSAIQYIVVSSAYRQVSAECSDFGRSFVKRENNVGPRTDPCGTPWVIMCVLESHPLILTNCLSSVRYSKNPQLRT